MARIAEHDRVQLSAAPLVEATPLTALGERVIPTELHFRRNHFSMPVSDPEGWRLEVSGSDGGVLALSLDDIKNLPEVSLAVVLECAGHRRAEYAPDAHGIPWAVGAISEATWSGARLADVLEFVELRDATHVVLEGADSGPAGTDNSVTAFARAIPLDKALDDDTLLAWSMNGEPLPREHGAPLRAIVPGWYATDSVKWLASIRAQAGAFDGYFEAVDYRLPDESGRALRRMTALPVNSLLTSHADGETVAAGPIELRGIAWGATASIAAVDVSINGVVRPASLEHPAGTYARVFWRLEWDARPGRHEIRVRAVDWDGRAQPDRPSWNPRGYANSSIQRVGLNVR